MSEQDESGRVPSAPGSQATPGAPDGSPPVGFDPSRIVDMLADLEAALVLTSEYSPTTTVGSFVDSSIQFQRLRSFLHSIQYAGRDSDRNRVSGEDPAEGLRPKDESAGRQASPKNSIGSTRPSMDGVETVARLIAEDCVNGWDFCEDAPADAYEKAVEDQWRFFVPVATRIIQALASLPLRSDGPEDMGVPASPSGLRPFGAEPATQSQAEPLVPNADLVALLRALVNGGKGSCIGRTPMIPLHRDTVAAILDHLEGAGSLRRALRDLLELVEMHGLEDCTDMPAHEFEAIVDGAVCDARRALAANGNRV